MQKDVYAPLHFGTAFNGAQSDNMIELVEDEEEDPCSNKVTSVNDYGEEH